jgi:two-component system, chemotaxis family, chemotaxis protein CheY
MSPPTILIVDDDAFVRLAVRDALADEPYCLLEAADGDAALARVGERLPDLVILDLFMPHRSGLQTLQQLRQAHPALPVLVLTSLDTEAVSADAFDKGASGFMGKPFHPVEMATTVKRLVGG